MDTQLALVSHPSRGEADTLRPKASTTYPIVWHRLSGIAYGPQVNPRQIIPKTQRLPLRKGGLGRGEAKSSFGQV